MAAERFPQDTEQVIMVRPPIPSSILHWRMRPDEIRDNSEFVTACVRLWDRGMDTKEIALNLFQPEYIVESATRLGRERRRHE